jgi:hypothetical protein
MFIGNIQGVHFVFETHRVFMFYWKHEGCASCTANIQSVQVVMETATIDILVAKSRTYNAKCM